MLALVETTTAALCRSASLADGVPVKVVSEMLDHAVAATALRIYAPILEEALAEPAGEMRRTFMDGSSQRMPATSKYLETLALPSK